MNIAPELMQLLAASTEAVQKYSEVAQAAQADLEQALATRLFLVQYVQQRYGVQPEDELAADGTITRPVHNVTADSSQDVTQLPFRKLG